MRNPSSRAPRFEAKARADKVGEIHVYDVIGDSWYGITAKQVVQALDGFKREGVKQLEIHVNSVGGSYFDGVTIFNALRRFEGQKTVYVDGLAASAASVVALAGDRIITGAGAMWMIHNPLTFAWGYASDLRKEADKLDTISESALQLYAGRTGQSSEDLRAWMDAETWMTPAEALERGFTHETTEVEPAGDPESVPAQGDDRDEEMNAMTRSFLAQFKHAPPAVAQLLHFASRPEGQAPATVAHDGAEEMPMKNLLKKLGLAENATEAEAMAAVEKMQSEASAASAERSEVMSATGATDARSACATIAGLREKAARADELQAQVAKFASERKQAEIAKLLDEATADGRLTPAKREELTGEKAPSFAAEPETLKTFLGFLEKPAPAPREPAVEPETPKAWAEMSNSEKAAMYAANRELAEKLKAEAEKK